MTNQKTELPDVIWAIEGVTTRYSGVWDDYKGTSDEPIKYIRADLCLTQSPDTIPLELGERMAEALKCWKLLYPIQDGETLYSGHPKVLTAEALAAFENRGKV